MDWNVVVSSRHGGIPVLMNPWKFRLPDQSSQQSDVDEGGAHKRQLRADMGIWSVASWGERISFL